MVTFIVFIVSLALMTFLVIAKGLELSAGRQFFLTTAFSKCDTRILRLWLRLKFWWSHINFKNTRLIFGWSAAKIRNSILAIKRRFDHEHSHFFAKKDHDAPKNKGSVSFFLKDVSDYKKTLREDKEE